MASALHLVIEARVEAKKDQLIKYNYYARADPDLLRDKVFCLCTVCSVMPIMSRNFMSLKGTAYAHRKVDVNKGYITKAELSVANGTKTFLPYGDFFLYIASMQRAK